MQGFYAAQKTGELKSWPTQQHEQQRMLTCKRLGELLLHNLQHGESYI